MTTMLPAGLTQRPAQLSDLDAVVEFGQVCDMADFGKADTDPEDILAEWREEGFDLQTDSCLLIAPDGQAVGYTDVRPDDLYMKISPLTQVHPAYRGQGLERYLLNFAEQRARQYLESPAGASIPRAILAYGLTDSGNRLLEEEGYELAKIDWRMEIDFTEPPLAPQWPQDVNMRPYIQGQEEGIAHRIIQEAFREFAYHTYHPFEDWLTWAIERNDFDPLLLFLVFDGEEPIGAVLAFDYGEMGGWVRQLAILKPWQGRGIGKQVLRHVFGEFYRRGARQVGLIVDSKNPSGATYFYQSAGMHIASQIRWYQKKM